MAKELEAANRELTKLRRSQRHTRDSREHDSRYQDTSRRQTPELADALTMLADVITKRSEGLPRKEPPIFKGDIFDYPVWINAFKILVEDRYTDVSDRIYYMGTYVTGEAKASI
jgi:hypothetical protein